MRQIVKEPERRMVEKTIVYPNPTTSEINIISEQFELGQMVILNALGQIIYRGEVERGLEKKVDLSRYENGLYIIRITDGVEKYTQRIMIER